MDRLINNLSGILQQELELTEDSREIAAYGLYMLFSTVIGFISIVVVGFMLGVLKLAVVGVLTASGLRVLSGGAHSANLRNCTLMGAIISPGIAVLAKKFGPQIPLSGMYGLVIAAGLFALWGIFTYAPADTPNKPIISELFKQRLRRMSFIYLLIWFCLIAANIGGLLFSPAHDVVLASTLGIIWQVYSITPSGYKLVASIDNLLP
jgi:accessory gene regulator B